MNRQLLVERCNACEVVVLPPSNVMYDDETCRCGGQDDKTPLTSQKLSKKNEDAERKQETHRCQLRVTAVYGHSGEWNE